MSATIRGRQRPEVPSRPRPTTVRDLRVAEVVRQDVVIENGQGSGFRVRPGISFKYESGD